MVEPPPAASAPATRVPAAAAGQIPAEPQAQGVAGPGPADLLDLLLGGLDLAEAVVSSVDDVHRHAATPCPEMDVEQLVGHVVAGLQWFAALASGGPVGGPRDPGQNQGQNLEPDPEPDPDPDPDLAGLPLGPVFAEAARAVRRIWTVQELERSYPMPWGRTSGREMASFMAVEVIGHAWDVAQASGQPSYPVEDLAAAALEVARGLDAETLRSPGMMGPPVEVAPARTAIDRLVGFLGRDPHWQPGQG